MRVCTKDGRLIESQSGGEGQADLDVMLKNAEAAGIEGCEARYCDDAEYQVLVAAAHEDSKTYADRRRSEYPPVTDYLDGIVKVDTSQVQAYIDACKAVKAKYPKPNA